MPHCNRHNFEHDGECPVCHNEHPSPVVKVELREDLEPMPEERIWVEPGPPGSPVVRIEHSARLDWLIKHELMIRVLTGMAEKIR